LEIRQMASEREAELKAALAVSEASRSRAEARSASAPSPLPRSGADVVLAEATEVLKSSTSGAVGQTYSLLQLQQGQGQASQLRTRADLANAEVVNLVKRLAQKHHSAALAQLASRIAAVLRYGASAHQDPFAKVKGLISELIASLESAASTDASHKAYCDKETAETTAKKEEKTAEIAKLSTAIDKMSSRIAVLEEEVAQLTKELADIAASKASYDSWFKESEDTYTSTKADMEKGIDGVKLALKILTEYYASDDKSHAAAGGAASGIIGLLEVVESDFTKGLAEIEAGFTNLKREYLAFTKEAELTTASKTQDVKYKSAEMTKLKKALGETTADKKGVQSELDAIMEYLTKINDICIMKAEPYAARVERRESELAGLKEALEVLEGEAVLLQQGRTAKKALRGVTRHTEHQ